MNRPVGRIQACGLAVALGVVGGCQTPANQQTDPFVSDRPATADRGPASRTSYNFDRVQAQVMDFADDFTLRLADLTDRIEARQPRLDARIAIHRLRYTMAHGLTVIAASQNPRVALIDTVVVMTIQRRLVEERLVPEYFEDTPWLANVFRDAEQQVKALANQTFTPEQMTEIQALCDGWVEANEYRHYAAYVRLADFAGTRQATGNNGAGRTQSLLGFLTLDPLAGLDPATREIEQTRLFAERALFYLQRMPQLISWQAELLYIDTASEPEVVQALLDISSITESVNRVTRDMTELRDGLPGLIAAEREAAIEQASDRLFEGFAAERTAMLDELEQRAERLDTTLESFTRAFEAGDQFSASAADLVTSVEALRASIASSGGEPDPDAEPTTIKDYESTIVSATTLVEKLDTLVADLNALAASDAWEQRRQTIDDTMSDAQQRLETVLDRTYRRAFTIVGVLLVGFFVIGLVLKLVPGRKRV
ncbi:MAG: hypothetical protein RIB60_00670 [Phycisphaerales bacterium]